MDSIRKKDKIPVCGSAQVKRMDGILLPPSESILHALEVIDAGALQVLLIVDSDHQLLGTVTDGDIRRGILRGLSLDEPISMVMNKEPATVSESTTRDKAIALMRIKSIHCIPVVDSRGRVVGLETESNFFRKGSEDTVVVLMAGGLGMRLRPLTETVPKPLLKVNGKPILERIIQRFIAQGFRRFYLSVNYKSEMIYHHFGNGDRWGVEIAYVHEDKPLGTGGALALLPKEGLSENIIVMNGDLLTTLNYRQMLDFHNSNHGGATMCVRDYSIQVPYGVVNIEGEKFIDIVEKPAHSYFINAGIYTIRSDHLKYIPDNRFFDLTDFFSLLNTLGKKTTVFPIREEWRDIGNFHDYELANLSADRKVS